jgi:hypothetical protein
MKKEIKLFLNENGKFTTFLTLRSNFKFSSRKTHLLFAIAFLCVSIQDLRDENAKKKIPQVELKAIKGRKSLKNCVVSFKKSF